MKLPIIAISYQQAFLTCQPLVNLCFVIESAIQKRRQILVSIIIVFLKIRQFLQHPLQILQPLIIKTSRIAIQFSDY